MISMRALECLVAIVEQGSLTKAAAVLHMSQPALSQEGGGRGWRPRPHRLRGDDDGVSSRPRAAQLAAPVP
jgi:hypothetical protein